jgi:hypothetical protein
MLRHLALLVIVAGLVACVSDPEQDDGWCRQMQVSSIAEQSPVQDQAAQARRHNAQDSSRPGACLAP